jgi:competence protein ComEC
MRWSSGDGVTLDVLAPVMPLLADTGDDINENSIVVMLRYQAFSELFMGDAGEASESRLLATDAPCHPEQRRGAAEDMAPTFVAAVHPRVAVISVGRHNTFGHPAESTLETWRSNGARRAR